MCFCFLASLVSRPLVLFVSLQLYVLSVLIVRCFVSLQSYVLLFFLSFVSFLSQVFCSFLCFLSSFLFLLTYKTCFRRLGGHAHVSKIVFLPPPALLGTLATCFSCPRRCWGRLKHVFVTSADTTRHPVFLFLFGHVASSDTPTAPKVVF